MRSINSSFNVIPISRAIAICVLCSLAILWPTDETSAQTTSNWLTAANGDWDDASNWSSTAFPNNGQPGAADTYDVVINQIGAPYTISIGSFDPFGNLPAENFTASTVTLDSSDTTLGLQSRFSPIGGRTDSDSLFVTDSLNVRQGSFIVDAASIDFGQGSNFEGNINQTGGAVSISGLVADSIVNQTGGAFSATGQFSNVQFNGTLDVTGDLRPVDGTQFSGVVNIQRDSGTGGVDLIYSGSGLNPGDPVQASIGSNVVVNLDAGVFGGTVEARNNVTLTIDPTATIRGVGELRSEGFFSDVVEPSIINQGTVVADVDSRQLQVAASSGGNIVNQGSLVARNGGDLFLNVADGTFVQQSGQLAVDEGTITSTVMLDIQGGEVVGNGTLDLSLGTNEGGLLLGGVLTPGIDGTGELFVNGRLELTDSAISRFELGGVEAGATSDGFDSVIVQGELELGGDLEIDLIEGFADSILLTDSFTILNLDPLGDSSLEGAFGNVANGEFLQTIGNDFQFQVNYGTDSQFDPNQVVLSNFTSVSVPEPSASLLLCTIATLLTLRRRRKA